MSGGTRIGDLMDVRALRTDRVRGRGWHDAIASAERYLASETASMRRRFDSIEEVTLPSGVLEEVSFAGPQAAVTAGRFRASAGEVLFGLDFEEITVE